MSQSLSSIYIHIIFSTKQRTSFLDSSIRYRLWQYIGGICNKLESSPIKIGGTDDHIHILCKLSRNTALQTLVTKIKADSSKWIKTISAEYQDFYWQSGYGAFSVNPQECDAVVECISNQEQHHLKRNFCDEFRLFLKKYKIEYDEKYLWE